MASPTPTISSLLWSIARHIALFIAALSISITLALSKRSRDEKGPNLLRGFNASFNLPPNRTNSSKLYTTQQYRVFHPTLRYKRLLLARHLPTYYAIAATMLKSPKTRQKPLLFTKPTRLIYFFSASRTRSRYTPYSKALPKVKVILLLPADEGIIQPHVLDARQRAYLLQALPNRGSPRRHLRFPDK